MVRVIVMAVVLCILEFIMDRVYLHEGAVSGDDNQYVIKAPNILRKVCLFGFNFGLFMFVIFTVTLILGVDGASVGHMVLMLTFMFVCALIFLWASRWKIYVDNGKMKIHWLLRKPREFPIDDIKYKVNRKGNLVLYTSGGKRLVTVDVLCENYPRLHRMLGV